MSHAAVELAPPSWTGSLARQVRDLRDALDAVAGNVAVERARAGLGACMCWCPRQCRSLWGERGRAAE